MDIKRSRKFAVKPYAHRLFHRFKKIAYGFDLDVIFSADRKVGNACAAIERKAKDHLLLVASGIFANPSFPKPCALFIELLSLAEKPSLGRVNKRLQHKNTLKGTATSHLSPHCRFCGYKLFFTKD